MDENMYKKGPQYYKADTKRKILAVSGVFSRYWEVSLDDFPEKVFSTFTFSRKDRSYTIRRSKQRKALETYLDSNNLVNEDVVGVGSSPTEDISLALGSLFVKHALDKDMKAEMIDLGNTRKDWMHTGPPDVLILHNITVDSPGSRIMSCRDWLNWAEGAMRIVCFAGTHPVEFFNKILRKPLDSAFFFEGNYRRHVNR
jgi:hypothetical protein